MRKSLLLAVLLALSVTGVAYAAVTNNYVVTSSIKPKKSGTSAHPVAISTSVSYTVTTTPAGQRPNVVKTLTLRAQGIRENTNKFPACGTARLTNPSEGPSTCKKGSLIGTGYFISKIGPSSSQSTVFLTCRAEVSVYNGGNHTLSYYVFKGAPIAGQPTPCPLPHSDAFVSTLKMKSTGLVQTFTVPQDLRHPTVTGFPPLDAAATFSTVSVPKDSKKIKKNGKKHKVGLFESISCPSNHQRQTALKFTLENGQSHTVTGLVPCK